MKAIAAKYVAPLILAVGIAGGVAGFELSEAFTSHSAENIGRENLPAHKSDNPSTKFPAPNKEETDKKRPSGPVPPTPIF